MCDGKEDAISLMNSFTNLLQDAGCVMSRRQRPTGFRFMDESVFKKWHLTGEIEILIPNQKDVSLRAR